MSEPLTRAQWGARSRKNTPSRLASPVRYLFAHHTVTPPQATDGAEFRQVQNVAFGRGFSDVSYSMMVSSRGTLAIGRGPQYRGAHTVTSAGSRQLAKYGKKNWNSIAVAVAVIGSTDNTPISPAQLRALQYAREWLIGSGYLRAPTGPYRTWRAGVAPQQGYYAPHQEVNATGCPGTGLIRVLGEINSPSTLGTAGDIGTPIVGPDTASGAQAWAWAVSKAASEWFVAYIHAVYAARGRGVNPIVMIAQAAHETNFGRFTGSVKPEWGTHNPAGIKTRDGADKDESIQSTWAHFPRIIEGVAAQRDHLALYAGVDGSPWADSNDPRHFESIKGKATTVEALSGSWATDPAYAKALLRYMGEIAATKAPAALPPTGPAPSPGPPVSNVPPPPPPKPTPDPPTPTPDPVPVPVGAPSPFAIPAPDPDVVKRGIETSEGGLVQIVSGVEQIEARHTEMADWLEEHRAWLAAHEKWRAEYAAWAKANTPS